MDYARFLEATGLLSECGLDLASAGRLAARLSKRMGISDLIERPPHGIGEIPTRTLEKLNYAYELYLERRQAVSDLERERTTSKAKPLPPEVLEKPAYAHSVRALSRVAKAAEAVTFSSKEERADALVTGVDLWERCFALTWRNGRIKCSLKDPNHPDALVFADLAATSVEPAMLQPHRWLAMRRGLGLGVLDLSLEIPVDSFLGQVTVLQEKLGPLLGSRSQMALLEELVVPYLEQEVFKALDDEMAEAAMWQAASSYFELLRQPPLEIDRVHSLYVPGQGNPVALAVVARDGELQAYDLVDSSDGWIQSLCARLENDGAEVVVVPVDGPDVQRLNEVKRGLAQKFKIRNVRPAGLKEARDCLAMDPDVNKHVKSAMVLALRAFKPFEEWSRIDPLSLGLAEYQSELNQERLRRLMLEMKIIARLRPNEENVHGLGALTTSFNPLVRELSDLKPGMPVPGTVTNITSFGVFVNIGLKQEGMIHISELSDNFVRDPHEVVKIGQQIQPRVLAVDEARKRISLTLRTGERRGPPSRSGPAGRKGARGGDRVQALKNLEDLFKKK